MGSGGFADGGTAGCRRDLAGGEVAGSGLVLRAVGRLARGVATGTEE